MSVKQQIFEGDNSYTISYHDDEIEEFCVIDRFGYCIPMQDIQEITDLLQRFMKNRSQEFIDKDNGEIEDARQEEMYRVTFGMGRDEMQIVNDKQANKRRGFVYFVQDGEGRVKIGKALNMATRMGEYTKLPTEPKVVHVFESEDYTRAEKIVHDFYKERRLRGEWFMLTDEDMAFVKSGTLEKLVR